jgi:cytidylate kinase
MADRTKIPSFSVDGMGAGKSTVGKIIASFCP